MIASPISAKHLIGRAQERSFFKARLAAAREDSGSVILLVGDAGTGKTRLQRAWLEAAAQADARTAYAVNYSYAPAPFAAVADALRALIARDRRLLPAEADARHLVEDFIGGAQWSEQGSNPWRKRRTFVVIHETLRRIAARVPVVIAIDDVHLADPETLELVQYLGSQCSGHGLVLVVAARWDEARSSKTHADAIGALERHAWSYRVVLGPLSESEVRELVFAALPPGAALGSRLVAEICRRSEGNPLFAEDLVRDALYAPARGEALPRSVEQSVVRRLDELADDEVAALEIAAVIGPTVAVETVAGVAGISAADALRVLRRGRELNVLSESTAESSVHFRHELIRSAISQRLLHAERKALHERIARWLESRAQPVAPALLAYHWTGAEDPDRAAVYALKAGALAFEASLFGIARDAFETALASRALTPVSRAEALEALGRADDSLGNPEAAYAHFEAALELRRAHGSAADAARLSLRLANAAYRFAGVETALARCRDAIDASAPAESSRFAAEVLLATFEAHRGALDEAERHLDVADGFAGERDPAYVVRYHLARATVFAASGDSDAWRTSATACVEAAEAYGDRSLTANCWINFAGFAGEQADFVLAERGFARAIELADAYALGYSGAYARVAAAEVARLRGDLSGAHALIRAACSLAADAKIVQAYAASVGIPIALDVGDGALAERLAERDVLEAAFRSNLQGHFAPLAAAHAELLIARDNPEQAAALIASTLAMLRGSAYSGSALLTFARLGTRADAVLAAKIFAASPERRSPLTELYACLVDAFVAQYRSPGERALRVAREARSRAHRLGTPLLEALAYELEGEGERALAIYRAAGAARDAERLERPRRRAAGRGDDGLTRREREIAVLVAAGHSNRDIANELVLSERTVEHHVAAALGKLTLRSRAELAAFIARASD